MLLKKENLTCSVNFLLSPECSEIGFYLSSPITKRSGGLFFCYIIVCLSGKSWNSAQTVYSIVMIVDFLPLSTLNLFTSLTWQENQPPPSSHCPIGGVLMVRSVYKTCMQIERSSLLTFCHMALRLHCGSHFIIFISNKYHLSTNPTEK